ncbi:IclR family transcriptional regulator [Actinoallomurus iriomotensis]|uniref:IclR family transcriptional regulator n=1 Tax=Actinoallomurus iriomotensis TaxID=478107 RepID=A0A9W6VTX5_9ACTN|nr:IclR family transcriptional regulator [Actinoallomurus iriomotensis]GLY78967.1 IclR family transcriptional regulator [Actinoallomurus iriomotensis]
MSPAHRNTGEITAVGRVAEILKQFAHCRGVLSAAALTQRTGLPKTTVYRMVGELVRVGLLERVGPDYRPGLLLFEIGETSPQQRDLREASRRHLLTLHEATRQNVGLALLDGFDVVHLEVFRSDEGPRLPQHSGGRWPAHASASGKAILAFMPAEQVVIPGVLQRFTPHTIVENSALRAELQRVRRRGVAFDRQEALNGIVGIAAPITGPDDEVLAAVSMSGVVGRIDTARMDAAVRTTAMTISRDLERARSIVRPILQRR